MPASAHLPDNGRRVNHPELVGSLMQQFLTMGNDQRCEAKTPGNFRKHQGFPPPVGRTMSTRPPFRRS